MREPSSDDLEMEDLIVRSPPSPHRKSTDSDGSALELGFGHTPRPTFKERLRQFGHRLWDGPEEPADECYQFKSNIMRQFEEFPARIVRDFPLKIRLPFVLLYFAFWLWSIRYILKPSLTELPTYTNDEDNPVEIVTLSCRDEKSMWRGKNAACGLDAKKCEPFSNRTVIFRCPALCDSDSWTYSSLTVGDESYKYRGYYIGGGKPEKGSKDLSLPYRGDSFPCGAAIHAGVISPVWGGCAKVEYTGWQESFASTKGEYGVYDSIEFDSFFPSSFKFVETGKCTNCYDMRFAVAIVNILLGLPVVYFGSGALAYWTMSTVGFWTVMLAVDPPIIVNVGDPESLPSLISLGFQRFLPFCFMAYTVWHLSVKRTFQVPSSPVLKSVLWYPLFWTGILNNLTYDRLPVDRLTVQDISTQPGALVTFVGIVSLISTCAVIQAYQLWRSGRFKRYLVVYFIFIVTLWSLAMLPGLNLRIHHYILALVLIPGTSTRGFTAFLFQGVLVGLLVNGISRWGLASVVETARALRRADPTGSVKPPVLTSFADGVLRWEVPDRPLPKIIDGEIVSPHDELSGVALLVNDVLRYLGQNTSLDFTQLMTEDPEFGAELERAQDTKLYLRVARASKGGKTSDFSHASVLEWPSGDFKAAPKNAPVT